jgi:iron complex transport system ATP-binding protein
LLQAANLRFDYAQQGRRAASARRPHGDSAPARTRVLDDVSVDVPPGILLGILGPNGSGKTTLLRLMSGALLPDSGQVTLDGRQLREISRASLARRIAVVPQETHLAFDYTVLEIALMGRYPHLGAFEVEGPADVEAALAALEATGTRELADRPFPTLSGGEKQRVIIASALAQLSGAQGGSRVLFLDEPTASLDLRYQIEIARVIERLHRQEHVSIVLSTHDLHFASSVCERVTLLREGQVLAEGAARDVLTADKLATLYDVDAAAIHGLLV